MKGWARIAIAGVAAGLVASFAMDRFQQAVAGAFGQDGDDDDEPATVSAARDLATAAGSDIPESQRRIAGSVVHYATGLALGIGYVAAAERWPRITAGFGTAYGGAATLLLDDAAVPVFGWGPWPWRTDAPTNLYGLTAHLVYGAALEGTRRAMLAAVD